MWCADRNDVQISIVGSKPKRHIQDDVEIAKKRRLDELIKLRNNLSFTKFYQLGPSHAPLFMISVTLLDGKEFTGTARSKELAKRAATECALRYISSIEKPDVSLPDNSTIVVSKQGNDTTSPVAAKLTRTSIPEKNPLAILNELRNGLKYTVVESNGPAHSPVFKVAVVVDGQEYIGQGRSKKLAKHKAAENALQSFIQFPDNAKVVSPRVTNNADFTQDVDTNPTEESSITNNNSKSDPSKSSVMILNEFYPSATYHCIENPNDEFHRFKVTVTVGSATFIGTGCRKKAARNAAATAAISKLLGDTSPISGPSPYADGRVLCTPEQQELADHIGRVVIESFMHLMADDTAHSKRKVIAGIVMTRNSDISSCELLTVTTGTKCISGEYISVSGTSLNDMHAEIVARRCLITYLLDELEKLVATGKSTIFEFHENKFKLRNGIDFHLYINTAPCGDARIFSPHEENDVIDKHPHRISRGQLRTKIESGEGTIPVKSSASVQTWDGIIQGERLLTMSCSDKVARWNVLGLQGSLLSHLLEPIYLKSIVLGGLMNQSHLYRAICGRIQNTLQGLSPPYLLNRPQMMLTTSSEQRFPAKAPSYSVNWYKGCDGPEVVNTVTGKPESGISRLCKVNMLKKFLSVYKTLNGTVNANLDKESYYCDIKQSATAYNTAKEQLFQAFAKADLGLWVKKPIEQDQFFVSV